VQRRMPAKAFISYVREDEALREKALPLLPRLL
jgi:hypothetical protein